jgi:3-mercaptopyruvate sulfurtransferase SseA
LPPVEEKSIADVASNVSVETLRHWSKKTEVWLDELIELLDAGRIRLIDVREPTEIEEMGSIPTSINIPRRLFRPTDGLYVFSIFIASRPCRP